MLRYHRQNLLLTFSGFSHPNRHVMDEACLNLLRSFKSGWLVFLLHFDNPLYVTELNPSSGKRFVNFSPSLQLVF